jgi:endonuclease YncB( thermonuclease family)
VVVALIMTAPPINAMNVKSVSKIKDNTEVALIKPIYKSFSLLQISLLIFAILLSSEMFSYNITGKVVSVQDGDTIEILSNKETYRIRLNGIDCPEKKQDFGSRAKQYTSEHCFGKTVTAWVIDKDRYGRYVADVILPNGNVLNEELVRSGLAWHYKQYSNSKTLAAMESKAKANKINLWSTSNPIPPWEFRHGISNKSNILNAGYYYASKNSNKYHKPTCQWAKKISESNLVVFKTKEDADKAGYKPCKSCKP